jgi:hypothetical protein
MKNILILSLPFFLLCILLSSLRLCIFVPFRSSPPLPCLISVFPRVFSRVFHQ